MTAILDTRTPCAAVEELRRLGHEVVLLPPAPALPAPVASHPDMLLFFAPDAILCTKSYLAIAHDELSYVARVANRPLRTSEADYGDAYPRDVLLNALPLGAYLFCHPRATASELISHPAYTVVPVRQGYAKCSAIPIGNTALISADPSILSAARERGIDVLEISVGNVRLDGYDYGFIGGCASFAPYQGTDTVYFCGDVQKHPEGARIESFCRLHGIRLQSLCDLPPVDVGTIFLI